MTDHPDKSWDSRGDRAEFDRDGELRALLAATDPARSLPAADPAGLAALLEDTMSHDTQIRPEAAVPARRTGTHDRNPLTWLVAAAAVVVIAGVGTLAASRLVEDGPALEAGPSGTSEPTSAGGSAVTALAAPPASPGRCAVPTAELLAMSDVAFAGTVTAVEGDKVTLETSTVYTGEVGDVVTVTAPAAELIALAEAVRFQVGRDYLVSGSDGMVSVCGLTGHASPALQRLYEQAFTR